MDYALPYASDMPPVEGFYQEVAATTNPLGLRGLGECGNPGLGGAIANAICDALGNGGAGITVLPLTPALVWGQLLRSGTKTQGIAPAPDRLPARPVQRPPLGSCALVELPHFDHDVSHRRPSGLVGAHPFHDQTHLNGRRNLQ